MQVHTIAGLSTLGGARQGQEQALLGADKNLAYQKAYQPLQTAERYGTGIASMISGYPGSNSTNSFSFSKWTRISFRRRYNSSWYL